MQLKKITLVVISFCLPIFTYAAPADFRGVVNIFIDLSWLVVGLIMSLTIFAFFWGLAKFINAAGNEQAVTDGKKLMTWGIIILFIATSYISIVKFLQGEFEFENSGVPSIRLKDSGPAPASRSGDSPPPPPSGGSGVDTGLDGTGRFREIPMNMY